MSPHYIDPAEQRLGMLSLADGTTFVGRSFGAPGAVAGEVVFHTGMVGYVEALTDPSYRGQILALTYPLQGNYGVPDGPFESAAIQVQALIVQRHAEAPSHRTSRRTLGAWLIAHNVPAIDGVDTRRLTRCLRTRGTVEGRLVVRDDREACGVGDTSQVDMARVLELVAPAETNELGSGNLRVLLVDTGAKDSIARSLAAAGARVRRVPWHAAWDRELEAVDGLVLGNGPGNPVRLAEPLQLHRLRRALELNLPVFGICLGHQWLAQAFGAGIYKLQFGHRSHNQPVRDLTTGRAYLTTQNHGFAVDTRTLVAGFEPWFVNLNDGTNEGLRHRARPFQSVQFHPEASAGPRDTRFLFDAFLGTVGECRVSRSARRGHRA